MDQEGKRDGERKKRRPTAEKRVLQDGRRRLRRSSFKSRVRTAVNAFGAALSSHDKDKIREKLGVVYGLMDKGVKRGIYKKNKSARVKSEMALRAFGREVG